MENGVFILLTIGLIYMCFHPEIHRFFRLHCPECDGYLEDVDQHRHILSTSTVYQCKSCKKKWI